MTGKAALRILLLHLICLLKQMPADAQRQLPRSFLFQTGDTAYACNQYNKIYKKPYVGAVLVGTILKGDRVFILAQTDKRDTVDGFVYPWYKIGVGKNFATLGYIRGYALALSSVSLPDFHRLLLQHLNQSDTKIGTDLHFLVMQGSETVQEISTGFTLFEDDSIAVHTSDGRGCTAIKQIICYDFYRRSCKEDHRQLCLAWKGEHAEPLPSVVLTDQHCSHVEFVFPADSGGVPGKIWINSAKSGNKKPRPDPGSMVNSCKCMKED